nr:hypothetical protein [Streptomyces sp. S.PB5]
MGVPYAAPPFGANRMRPPQPVIEGGLPAFHPEAFPRGGERGGRGASTPTYGRPTSRQAASRCWGGSMAARSPTAPIPWRRTTGRPSRVAAWSA